MSASLRLSSSRASLSPMIPFPLPPILAHLHELLEGYTETRERGFFMAEQDRNHEARAQPVLMFLSAVQLNDTKGPDRRSPAWMGEVVLGGVEPSAERLARYAQAGVLEFWRVREVGEGFEVEVWNDPHEAEYRQLATYREQELIRSQVFKELELRPSELPRP